MNKNIFIVLIGGFVVAVLVAMLVQMSLGGSKKEEIEVVTLSVLVAAKDIPVGHELEAEDLKWKKWPESVIFPGAILREEDQAASDALKGKTIRSINEGEPVHMSAVVQEAGGFLSAKVGHGMRAIGITVRKHIVADRLVMPGDIVDIIVTYRVRVNARQNPEVASLVNRYASETILENVRILAIDTNTSTARGNSEDGKKKKKAKSKKKVTVTLEVTPEGAEQLMLAGEMGDISFATRGIAKEEEKPDDNMTTDVRMSRVLTDLSKLTSGGGGGSVRIFSGATMEEVRGRRGQEEVAEGIDFSVEERPNDAPTAILGLPPQSALEGFEE